MSFIFYKQKSFPNFQSAAFLQLAYPEGLDFDLAFRASPVFQAPFCNGAAVTEFRLEWGAAEGSMQVIYSGSATSYELKGLLPATNYFCRVQVSVRN